MKCPRSSQEKQGQTIRRVLSSGVSLLMIASFSATFTSIPLFPSPSFAAPAPFAPPWMLPILDDLRKNGELSPADLRELKKRAKGSLKSLDSVLNRINQFASRMGLKYRLAADAQLGVDVGDPTNLEITVIDPNTDTIIHTYILGPGTKDVP